MFLRGLVGTKLRGIFRAHGRAKPCAQSPALHQESATATCFTWTPDRWAGAVGPRDRLPKLAGNYKLPSNQEANAISCFAILPEFRGKGLANFLLGEMVKDLAERGVKRLEAYPRRGEQLEAEEVWTGPESIFLQAGFQVERDDPVRPVMLLRLPKTQKAPGVTGA